MKLFIILSVVACASCAKLDRTYLPPNAQSSSGSNFLQAPDSRSNGQGNGFHGNGFNNENVINQNGNGFSQNDNNFNQIGNDYNQNGNAYNQNGNDYNQNGNDYNQNGNAFNGNGFDRPERPQASFERNAAILRQDSQNDGETYSYAYETENGISAEESGVATNGVEAQGGYSYTGDDGQVYTIRYTADQNGFVPVGDHLPTPPPVPEEILKALEQNARDEAAGIYDDGSYNEGKYGDDNNQYNGNYNSGNNFDNSNNYNSANSFDNNNFNGNSFNGNNVANDGNDEDTVVTNAAFRSGSRGFAGATKAYLPPVQSQRTNQRRPSFNARDGYNY
ncbi:pupal cuticle protein 36a-like [Leguminivora glycinivorella]|uniref:pupal cuticle protein 36a-like n=1 Tax=Leguminivora glycinivorella TaxID=1035111 RepID=UPI00200C49CE|nr:pupal cuticle protein 36a-like [Leguminivora glycinivorella]